MFRLDAQFIAIVESAIEIGSMALGQAFGGMLQCRNAHCQIMFALATQGERSSAGD